MSLIRKETKQSSLIHQRIRKANFVPLESQEIKRFKYLDVFKINKYVKKKLVRLKFPFVKNYQRLKLLIKKIDWKKMMSVLSIWILEAFVEGITANFATHYLFNVNFNLFTIFAHGIIIKQGLSIYWRLKKDGEFNSIPTKNQ